LLDLGLILVIDTETWALVTGSRLMLRTASPGLRVWALGRAWSAHL